MRSGRCCRTRWRAGPWSNAAHTRRISRSEAPLDLAPHVLELPNGDRIQAAAEGTATERYDALDDAEGRPATSRVRAENRSLRRARTTVRIDGRFLHSQMYRGPNARKHSARQRGERQELLSMGWTET